VSVRMRIRCSGIDVRSPERIGGLVLEVKGDFCDDVRRCSRPWKKGTIWRSVSMVPGSTAVAQRPGCLCVRLLASL
jgi:hypothetical protein